MKRGVKKGSKESSPGWKRKRLKAGNLPPAVASAEATFGHCPKGHKLPNHTAGGQCSPLYCAAEKVEKRVKKESKRQYQRALVKSPELREVAAAANKEILARIPEGALGAEEAREAALVARGETIARLGTNLGRWSARKAYFKVPDGLEGAEAEEWAQKRAVTLLPDALAEVEYQLKFGDDAQRREAARDVLDMNGMRKKENLPQGGQTIILNIAGGTLPWEKPAKTVEGETNLAEVDPRKAT